MCADWEAAALPATQQGIRVVSRGKDVEYLRRLVEAIHPRMEHAAKYRRFTIYVAETPRCGDPGIGTEGCERMSGADRDHVLQRNAQTGRNAGDLLGQ